MSQIVYCHHNVNMLLRNTLKIWIHYLDITDKVWRWPRKNIKEIKTGGMQVICRGPLAVVKCFCVAISYCNPLPGSLVFGLSNTWSQELNDPYTVHAHTCSMCVHSVDNFTLFTNVLLLVCKRYFNLGWQNLSVCAWMCVYAVRQIL